MGQDEKKGVGTVEKGEGGKREGLHQVVITRDHFPKLSLSLLILDSWWLPLIFVHSLFFELFDLDLVIPLLQFRALQPISHPDLRQTITTDQNATRRAYTIAHFVTVLFIRSWSRRRHLSAYNYSE